MSAADAGFEHASTPHRQFVGLAEIVNLLGLAKSSHAADFDIHDPTSSGFDGSGTIAGVTNGFIEADRSAQFTLKPRVVIDVIVPERLFDHEQVELIEFAKMINIIERVGRIRITTEQDIGPPRANTFENLEVPSRFHFEFDPAVPGGEFELDLVDQLLDGILNADGNSTLNFLSCAAEKFP